MDRRKTHIVVENETDSKATRTTNDGRVITYEMKVLQQPIRARACGQGAKSSADRRPVDPPPIVELKIFEGEKHEDITYNMHANYFLFATLEQARPIAHARGQDRNTHPVLTGTPVAGMVYLDRPSPAGYFIFPDLSVRHEGEYRLSFSLYEELKNPKDEDKLEKGNPNAGGDAHVTHRLEVKSAPFHVFSAKKFPGLTESTHLSRMVAEQGCRVRIRRDVRMRRREPKSGGKDWDEYKEETAAARARASATPDPNMYPPGMQTPHGFIEPAPRPRSASNASHQSLGSLSRRPSVQEMGQAYHQQQPPHYGTAPHTPQNGYPQTAPYGPSPGQQYSSNQFMPQPPPMQPPPPQQYQPQSYPAPPPVTVAQQPPPPKGYYSYPPAPAPPQITQAQQYSVPSHAYESGPPQHRPSIDYSAQDGYRRNSQHIPPPPHHASYNQPMQPQYATQQYQQPPPPQAPQHSAYPSMDLYNSRPAPIEPHHRGSTPASKGSFDLPPLNTSAMSNNKLEASSPTSAAPSNMFFSAAQTPVVTHKRSFGDVFSNRHQNGPLRQGQRPSYSQGDNLSGGNLMSAADDDNNANSELDTSTLGMHYRRADGRQIQRALPGHL